MKPGGDGVPQGEGVRGVVEHTQRENPKKPANPRKRSTQANQWASKKTKTKKTKPKKQHARVSWPITEGQRQKLEHRWPGVSRLLGFFRAAGIRVEMGRRGSLWINGSQTLPLAGILRSSRIHDWNKIIDEMALAYASGKFIRAVEDNARFGEGLRAFLRPREKGFAIMRGQVRLAIIHPTTAHIPHRDAIHANFLKPGTHWQQVADLLHEVEAELIAEWERTQEARAVATAAVAAVAGQRRPVDTRRRIDRLPDNLAPELIAACLDASRRIRLDRQVAYERPVILECGLGELTLLPVAMTRTRLLMPFRLSRQGEALRGELVLADRDPLPLLIGEDVAETDAITAWTCALLGFADATCIELEPVTPTERRQPPRPRRHPPSPAGRHQPSARALPRKQPWPGHLEPVGHWTRFSGSFVAGHRRRLTDGRTGTPEAHDRARQVGITLQENETWVRPHTRGVPADLEMRFLWHAPAELTF